MPVRIQLKRTRGWKMPENTVSVARPSYWGNPWRVGRDGDAIYCVSQYRNLLTGKPVDTWPISNKHRIKAMYFCDDSWARLTLAGKNLACYCPLDQPCHADVLLELANTP